MMYANSFVVISCHEMFCNLGMQQEKAGLMDIGTDVLELLQEGCQDVAPLKDTDEPFKRSCDAHCNVHPIGSHL